jgi:type III restriction enzyme
VNQDGQRVFDEAVNKLYVVANESYEDFARALQEEYEEDCGVTFGNPQRFMDAVTATLKAELHRLIVDGIKYERISSGDPDFEWEMKIFDEVEIINYLTAIQVQRSVYEYVVYDSEVEREFAKRLNEREDIRLFLKLPGGFEIDTLVGKYNPDWAIVKHEDETLYLVRETKSTKDFLRLRTTEADKVRCGAQHFKALDVPFAVVVDVSGV